VDIRVGRYTHGETLSVCQSAHIEAVGIDITQGFVERAVNTYGVDARCCSLEEADFPAGSFDAVTMCALIEHVYRPAQLLRGVNRVLKRNGILFIDMPNDASPYNRAANFYFRMQGRSWVSNCSPMLSPFHVQGFTPQSALTLFNKTRLTPLYQRFYSLKTHIPVSGWRSRFERRCQMAVLALEALGHTG